MSWTLVLRTSGRRRRNCIAAVRRLAHKNKRRMSGRSSGTSDLQVDARLAWAEGMLGITRVVEERSDDATASIIRKFTNVCLISKRRLHCISYASVISLLTSQPVPSNRPTTRTATTAISTSTAYIKKALHGCMAACAFALCASTGMDLFA